MATEYRDVADALSQALDETYAYTDDNDIFAPTPSRHSHRMAIESAEAWLRKHGYRLELVPPATAAVGQVSEDMIKRAADELYDWLDGEHPNYLAAERIVKAALGFPLPDLDDL